MSLLPERPHLDHLRKQAKELLRRYRAGDPAALATSSRVEEWRPRARQPDQTVSDLRCANG